MKNVVKSIVFIVIFIIIYIGLSYIFLPQKVIKKYGMYNTSMYEILGEKENKIDTLVVGDSLVYSSVSPVDIYDQYGYTVFDCSEPAQIISDAYDYFKIASETQQPKVAIIEANIFFRDANKRPWYNKPTKIVKNILPLATYHNNWKKMIYRDKQNNSWMNISKGYKKNTAIKASENYDYMQENAIKQKIPKANYKYIDRFIHHCEKNGIKLIFISLPSQKSWNNEKCRIVKEIAQENKIEYINLNDNNILNINWKTETKDHGSHLNYYGAKKVSKYIGEYLKSLNILTNHSNEKEYEEWNRAVKYYLDD